MASSTETILKSLLFVLLGIAGLTYSAQQPQSVDAYLSSRWVYQGESVRISWYANNSNLVRCAILVDDTPTEHINLEASGVRYLTADTSCKVTVTCQYGTQLKASKSLQLLVKPIKQMT
ncbi:MAG: hypothetical protein HWE13_09540 [Gammaproteobacteria bacterium]|nr:hypothetical protein [Gammaproteobacteria bacterium]NVK88359.1 hypothetical protein [Gammaproteobacteria bacterium]